MNIGHGLQRPDIVFKTCAGYAAFAVVHSVLAAPTTKQFAAHTCGEHFVRHYYRFGFVLVSVATFTPLLYYQYLVGGQQAVVTYTHPVAIGCVKVLNALAVVGILVSLRTYDILDFIGLRALCPAMALTSTSKKHDTAPLENADQLDLKLSPVHRWVRHPLYFFAMAQAWLVAPRMTEMQVAVAVSTSLYFLLGSRYLEDPKLDKIFGEAYVQYRRLVPGVVPLPYFWRVLDKKTADKLMAKCNSSSN
eukprot:PhM_4_TR1871/c0_g1_i1/m.58060/K21310/mddA; methanethiol S-methyltransferase